jgi:hypothetical protein
VSGCLIGGDPFPSLSVHHSLQFSFNLLTSVISSRLRATSELFIPTFFVWWYHTSCYLQITWGGGHFCCCYSLLMVFVHLRVGPGILHPNTRTTLLSLRPFVSSLLLNFNLELSTSRLSFFTLSFVMHFSVGHGRGG